MSVDFYVGPMQIIRPHWIEQHVFIPGKDPHLCGYTEGEKTCEWPVDSEYHKPAQKELANPDR